jgi:hypothetical protein
MAYQGAAPATCEAPGHYVFECSTAAGVLRDRFTYDGPFADGYALAEARGAARGAPFISHVARPC